MAPLSEEAENRRRRGRTNFLALLFCQLIWIFPIAFFLLSSSPEIVIPQDTNAIRFHGPFKAFNDSELELLKKINEDWRKFRTSMKETFERTGLMQPWDKSCFIWLPECYLLAKHEKIIQIVEEAIGPNVLLYGMKVWKGRNDPMETFHKDMESLGCEKSMNFISGRTVQLISQSNKVTERMSQIMLKILHQFEKGSSRSTGEKEQLIILEKFFTARVKRIVRDADVWFENLMGQKGYGVLFHGGTIYRIGAGLNVDDDEGLLMHFVSSDCKVRHLGNHVWGIHGISHSLYIPPVLLVSGNLTNNQSAPNDVRHLLAKDETLGLNIDFENEDTSKPLGTKLVLSNHSDLLEESPEVEIFMDSNTRVGWHEHGIWMFRQVGEIRTSLIERGRIEQFFLSEKNLLVDFDRVLGDGKQALVVSRHGMRYFRSCNDGKLRHWELLELRPGSAVLLLRGLTHAFMPLGKETSFLSFSWVGYDKKNTSIREFKNGHTKFENNIMSFECYVTHPTGGQTITLVTGQAYDPDNSENCDVIVFVVEGQLLQLLPSNDTIQAPSTVLIPAGKSLVLWNIGHQLAKFFALHVCHCDNSMQTAMSFGATGKIF